MSELVVKRLRTTSFSLYALMAEGTTNARPLNLLHHFANG